MFIRRKKNQSGSISVQIVAKQSGKVIILKSIGSAKTETELIFLLQKAEDELLLLKQSSELPFHELEEEGYVTYFRNSIKKLSLVGPELILGKVFDKIGFNAITEDLFRHLVITRLIYPVSKLKTTDYLFKYKGIQKSVYSIYRYLDKLYGEQSEQVKQIALQHVLKISNNNIGVVFYDVTTLYFETKNEDEFKQTGFSKDGKHQQPQIVLGLLVNADGYPLDYDVFEGSKYEGDTLLPILNHFINKYKSAQLTVVADAGLLSTKNIIALQELSYHYILGARIKNESEEIKQKILSLQLKDNQSAEIDLNSLTRLIIGYKKSRAINDKKNRERGLEKLQKRIKSGKITKSSLNNKGYNKYLKINGKATISIDKELFKADAAWDGLKGYKTNTTLTKDAVIHQYSQLWNVEKTFRISKHDLQIRPIYHQLKRRIEAHICIAFCACMVYKELERLLKIKGIDKSAEKVIDITKTIYEIEFTTPFSKKIHRTLLQQTPEQKQILTLFTL
jgi:transposase